MSDDEFIQPRLKQLLPLIPLGIRYLAHAMHKRLVQGRRTPMEKPIVGKCIYGVPLGGMGAGTIGRGFRGEFCRFQMVPGVYKYHTVWADAFHLVIRERSGEKKVLFKTVLASKKSSGSSGLRGCCVRRGANFPPRSWEYNITDVNIDYIGLYPQAWTTYTIPEFCVTVICRQISPFIPHNYDDSCLPAAAFQWTIVNESDRDLDFTLAFTFKNGWGSSKHDPQLMPWTEDVKEMDFKGAQMHQTLKGLRLTYGIGASSTNGTASRMTDFDPNSDGSDFIRELVTPLGHNERRPEASRSPRNLCMAVRLDLTVKAKSVTDDAQFALVWDMPQIRFGKGKALWTRRYTRFLREPATQKFSAAPELLQYTFNNHKEWEKSINAWQKPVLEDSKLPEWFKSAIFNEMYYLADGGTQWLEFEQESDTEDENGDPRKHFGRFCYLESHEYRQMYNTFDVHFYASWALISLFPALQVSLQLDFCHFTREQDPKELRELYSGKMVMRNSADFVPHDLGDPEGEPFLEVNAYRVHDISDWKDLNLKLVISVVRDIKLIRSVYADNRSLMKAADYLEQTAWPVVLRCLTLALEWDKDGDDLIENGGFPDQTFDIWVMTGPSAYCGGLWLAALTSFIDLARSIGGENELEEALRWEGVLDRAKQAYNDKLWDDKRGFFKFDTTSKGEDSVMADQLCGHWYLKMSGLPSYITQEQVNRALDTIFEMNVRCFRNGTLGAINGARFQESAYDDVVDPWCGQSEEMWTGITYGLAALMMAEGEHEKAFRTAQGVYESVWNTFGQAYETPEAAYPEKVYRALGYMRPLSIWAMLLAWQQRKVVA